MHENSVGLSSTTNPKPKGQPSISLPAHVHVQCFIGNVSPSVNS